MAQISVDPESLAADGMALIDALTSQPPPVAEPASAHSTSAQVVANLNAQSQALNTYIDNGLQKLNEGGAAHVVTAANFRATEDANAAAINANASTSGGISAPTLASSVSDPVSPGIPSILPLTPMTGKAHSIAYNTSTGGTGSLRALADYWQARAVMLETVGTDTSQTGVSVNMHWSDSGVQLAGANTTANGSWFSEVAQLALALAAVCNDAADQQDQAVATTPTPQEFTDAENLVTELTAANQASGGLLTGQVAEAQALVALLHSQATEAATTHHTASTATVNSTSGQGTSAPSITSGTGGTGAGASASSSVTASANNTGVNTGATNSAQLAANSGATTAGTDSGANQAAQMAQTMSMLAPLSSMGMMGPMSAMSSLGGLGRQNTTPTGFEPGSALADAAMDNLGDVSPAGGVGGGMGALAEEGAALPMASASHASPTALSGPAASVMTSAEAAGVSPASAPTTGAGGMSTYPPMMGGAGAGDAGAQRNMRLYPDRRVVSRPVPNTEAVFGELERERRPRGKRAAKEEEGTKNGG